MKDEQRIHNGMSGDRKMEESEKGRADNKGHNRARAGDKGGKVHRKETHSPGLEMKVNTYGSRIVSRDSQSYHKYMFSRSPEGAVCIPLVTRSPSFL